MSDLATLLADVRRAAVLAHEGPNPETRSDGYVDLDAAAAALLRYCAPPEDDHETDARDHADRRRYERMTGI